MPPKKSSSTTTAPSAAPKKAAFGSTTRSKVTPVAPAPVASVSTPAPAPAPVAQSPAAAPTAPAAQPQAQAQAPPSAAQTVANNNNNNTTPSTPSTQKKVVKPRSPAVNKPETKKYKKKHNYFLVDELGHKIKKETHGYQGCFKSTSHKYAATKAVTRKVPNPIRIKKSGARYYRVFEGSQVEIEQKIKEKNDWMKMIPVHFRPIVRQIGKDVDFKEMRKSLEAQTQQAQQTQQTAVSA